jgi:4'-phosphopantetheinyl transferase
LSIRYIAERLYRTPESIRDLALGVGEVHLWSVPLTGENSELLMLRGLLSPEERARADRFRFAKDHNAYTIARAMLRLLLARYTHDDPKEIEFSYAVNGKPSLASEKKVSFNLSHSGELALYAFTRDSELGVDIERFRAMSDMEQVAKHFFSKGEVNDLLSLAEEERQGAFFRCWTRKEAFVKAIGDGLSMPLDCFRVSLKAEQPAELLEAAPEHLARWSLYDVTPCEGYAAALVCEGEIGSLQCRRIRDVASGISLLKAE